MQILEQKHQLSFHLQQQRLIELIREGNTEEALEHAQEYLAPPGEEDPGFLEELGMLITGKSSLLLHSLSNLCMQTSTFDLSWLVSLITKRMTLT